MLLLHKNSCFIIIKYCQAAGDLGCHFDVIALKIKNTLNNNLLTYRNQSCLCEWNMIVMLSINAMQSS